MHFLSRRARAHPLSGTLAVAAALALGIQGCSTKPDKGPLNVVRDVRNSPAKRIMAVETLRETQSAGARTQGSLVTPRDLYTEIAWTVSQPPALRAAVLDAMLNDSDPKVVDDAKETAKLLLPKESTREVVVVICKNAGTKGWTEFTPSIVRAYARALPGVPESDRVERQALLDLHPGRTLEETIFDVFLNPPQIPTTEGIDWTMRFRADAWNALGRLDETGTTRAGLLARVASSNDPVVAAINACKADLRSVPINGEELTWLVALRDPEQKENAAWWAAAKAAIAGLPQNVTSGANPFFLRHAEAVRWAAAARKEYLAMSREELASTLAARLQGRTFIARSVVEGKKETHTTRSERLEARLDSLVWGDLLTILAIDEAIRQPQVVSALFAQARADRSDTTTEYGGLLAWKATGQTERAVVMLYMPRSAQRVGDLKFIASDDMIRASGTAQAHYHFHVQAERNAQYAGPSLGDLEYATRFGRACVVFTSIEAGVLAADYYQPEIGGSGPLSGVVVDLGTIMQTK
jgi:hypothetical protein